MAADHHLRAGLDCHMVGGRETGNETWVLGLVKGFQELETDLELLAYHAGTPWTEAAKGVSFPRLATANPYVRLGLELPWRSLADRLDVLHMTYVGPFWSAAPVVLTVHDISYVTNPEWFSPRDLRVLSAAIPSAIKRAAVVHTVSEDSRSLIVEHYRVPPEKVRVVPSGAGPAGEPIDPEEARQAVAQIGIDPDRPYLLAVGNLQPRKNLVRLIEAYQRLIAEGHGDADLVLVGPKHFQAHDVFAAASAVTDRIHFTGYLDARQLAACYRCCAAFVFPSLYEGFGAPAVEAMVHGAPIASARAGSLPEVCQDAALFFDPLDGEAITDALATILGDDALRERLVLAGRERAKEFEWKKNAARVLDLYRLVARSRDSAHSST
jgi:glycosyltransferase involved in cell wall biosynthesis